MIEALIQFIGVAILMWASPGPNNMMLANSGARFGFRRTVPHLLGIVVGTVVLVISSVTILGPILERWPLLTLGLKITGSFWLVYLGWKMATAPRFESSGVETRPMSFLAAALFQFVNPKAVSAVIVLMSILLGKDVPRATVYLAICATPFVGFLSVFLWVVAGMRISRYLSTDTRWKWFSWISGGMVAACAVLVWY